MTRKSILLLLMLPSLLPADGGVLVLRGASAGLVISVFAAPAPVRAASVDFSVLVQRGSDNSVVMDAQPALSLSHLNTIIRAMPSHANATNRLLYAAAIDVPNPGVWEINLRVDAANVSGPLTVLPNTSKLASYWPYLLAVPGAVLLFVLNQWLNRRRRSG